MKVRANGIQINYELSGKEDGPLVVMSHSLGCNLNMWDAQVKALEPEFRILRYDIRGHGLTDAPQGPYTLEMLGEDAAALVDALNLDKIHLVGLSLGGLVGQYMALNHPEILKSLILCDTAPAVPQEVQHIFQERIDEARQGGMEALLQSTLEDWFTPEFRASSHPSLEEVSKELLNTPVEGFVGCICAIRQLNYLDRLGEITIPTLIMVGEEDPGTPVDVSRLMHERINNSQLVIIPGAAHLSNVNQSDAFNTALLRFLREQP